MLSIWKLGWGQEAYYLSSVAQGIEDYYTGEGEAPGRWVGQGAARLGLGGDVDGAELRNVLAGVDPTGTYRLAGRAGLKHVPGWDLTFSAPKSVSVLYALGDHDTASTAAECHRRAVEAGLAYLEANATTSRRRIDGRVHQVEGAGLVVAAFRHRTSRAGDPHLHTHCLAANLVERVDGSGWGALHSPVVYRHARAAGFLYQAVLRAELTEHLGLRWGPVINGCAEIDGIDPALRDRFSTRHAQITEALTASGDTSAGAARVALLETRPAKETVESTPTLRDRWRAEAVAFGWEPGDFTGLGGHKTPVVTPGTVTDVVTTLTGPRGLTMTQASFERREVTEAWCASLPPGAPVSPSSIEELTDRLISDAGVVPLASGRDRYVDAIVRRAPGGRLSVTSGARRWSTTDMLQVEARLLDAAAEARGTGVAVVDEGMVDEVLDCRADLTDEQAAMVRAVTTSRDGMQVVVGRAGSGKTYALAAAAEVWRAAGFEPIGVATAARAAAELEQTAGIPSTTIAQFLIDADQAPHGLLDAHHVVIADSCRPRDYADQVWGPRESVVSSLVCGRGWWLVRSA